MDLTTTDHSDSESVSDADNSVTYTPTTTSKDFVANFSQSCSLPSCVPSHGFNFIIRSISSMQVITLLDGKVTLAPQGGPGSTHWDCVESEGWLGFRDPRSNKFLCHDMKGRLKCSADRDGKWRHFSINPMPQGGYIMQMPEWWTLRPIVINVENGLERTGKKLSDGVVWEFLKV